MRLFIALFLLSTAVYAQTHYVHQWMQTGCSYIGLTRVCSYTCLIGGEQIVLQE